MDEMSLSKSALRVLKDLLKQENNNEIIISECYHTKFSEEITELKDALIIKSFRFEEDDQIKNGIKRYYKITKCGKNYLEKLRKDRFRFWFPTIISVGAFIISVLTFIYK